MFYLFIILGCIFLINTAVFYLDSEKNESIPKTISRECPSKTGYYNYEYLDYVYYPYYYPYPYLEETIPILYYPYV